MNILFVHQNMPGQYREMVQWLVAQGGHRIVFLTQRNPPPKIAGVETVQYRPKHKPAKDVWGLSKVWEEATGVGFGAALAARKHAEDTGFRPDIVIGHTGWGELLFFKDIWPDVPILGFFEYFYRSTGGTVGFDPEEPTSAHTPFLMRARNAVPYASIEAVDQGIVPTKWQKDRFPDSFHPKLALCHDGIRTDLLCPDPTVTLPLGRLGRQATRGDEIFTYVARNMERTRGFHTFMRALPQILSARPQARAVIVGGNETSYGPATKTPGGLRADMEREVGHLIDWDRVHFLGRIPYPDFKRVVQISRCHIYLTMPFVLSWSLLESMSMQATIVASDVAPVREVIDHGRNGLLVDFFDPDALAARVVEVLAAPGDYAGLGVTARADVVERYDFLKVAMPFQADLINGMAPGAAPIAV